MINREYESCDYDLPADEKFDVCSTAVGPLIAKKHGARYSGIEVDDALEISEQTEI